MWKVYKDFYYKTMKYENSCFPCSLHMVLANLGYIGYKYEYESVIEDLWNTFHKDLNKSAPNEKQVHEYLMKTPYLDGKASLYTPTSFQNRESAQAVCDKLKSIVLKERKNVGMVAGVGHAHVFYKKGNKGYMHVHPSPDEDFITCEEIKLKDVIVLEGKGKEYAIGIVYDVNGEEVVQPAHFLLTII